MKSSIYIGVALRLSMGIVPLHNVSASDGTGGQRLAYTGESLSWQQILKIKLDAKTTEDVWEHIHKRVMSRASNDSVFLQKVRHTLRWSQNPACRHYATAIILRTDAESQQDDIMFMLSDADDWISSAGYAKMRILARHGKWKSLPAVGPLAAVKPSLLLAVPLTGRSSPAWRRVVIWSVWDAMGITGMPFYSRSLMDEDVESATLAAKFLARCPAENAVPLFVRSLALQRDREGREAVCDAILAGLDKIQGKSAKPTEGREARIAFWLGKLEDAPDRVDDTPPEAKHEGSAQTQ